MRVKTARDEFRFASTNTQQGECKRAGSANGRVSGGRERRQYDRSAPSLGLVGRPHMRSSLGLPSGLVRGVGVHAHLRTILERVRGEPMYGINEDPQAMAAVAADDLDAAKVVAQVVCSHATSGPGRAAIDDGGHSSERDALAPRRPKRGTRWPMSPTPCQTGRGDQSHNVGGGPDEAVKIHEEPPRPVAVGGAGIYVRALAAAARSTTTARIGIRVDKATDSLFA